MSKRFCPYCLQEDTWDFADLKLKDGTKVYVNAAGARWAGRRCPSCEKLRVKYAVTYDDFERKQISEALQKDGYQLLADSMPLKAQRQGQILSVHVRRAYIRAGSLVVDQAPPPHDGLTVILFQEVRILDTKQIDALQEKMLTYTPNHRTQHAQMADSGQNLAGKI